MKRHENMSRDGPSYKTYQTLLQHKHFMEKSVVNMRIGLYKFHIT
jgi:hypothetical protein